MKSFFGLFSGESKKSLDEGLEKTRESFFSKIGRAVAGKSTIDDEILDQIEEILISSDVGISTTIKIIEKLQARVSKDKYLNTAELSTILKEEIITLLSSVGPEVLPEHEPSGDIKPYVILVVGVNGVGKTTTIGKLAGQLKGKGKLVVMGAADTFRAAAVEQLKLWGKKVDVRVVEQGMNADPGAVAYETVKVGLESGADFVIIDTAGRLHTKVNLMNELSKIKRVVKKLIENAPHEVMLVLDGSTGQNAFIQAREFTKATEVTSIAVTKLDGTAKGGVVIGISDEFNIPVKYIGVGEKIEDLQVFDKIEYVDSLFKKL